MSFDTLLNTALWKCQGTTQTAATLYHDFLAKNESEGFSLSFSSENPTKGLWAEIDALHSAAGNRLDCEIFRAGYVQLFGNITFMEAVYSFDILTVLKLRYLPIAAYANPDTFSALHDTYF